MGTPNKEDTQKLELPDDDNKLFDEGDDIGNSTIPDISLPIEDANNSKCVWEYAINDLLQLSLLHAEGKILRNWVRFQPMENI